MKKNIKPKADILFEVSWEVCNKVGGIFTVLSSKVRQMQRYYKRSGYFMIGPYFDKKSRMVFKEEKVVENCRTVYNKLKKVGIVCHFGTWMIDGEPNVILIDYSGIKRKTNEIKKEMWDNFKLDSLNSSNRFDEIVVWSWSVGYLIKELKKVYVEKKVVLHIHEWLSGGVILYLKGNNINIPTVFTTHATILGRTLASKGNFSGDEADFYSSLDKINPEKEAYKYNIQAKYSMEKISAEKSDVFTTVSQITAAEAKYLLQKEVDLILPNGLSISNFPSFEETALKHKKYRKKLREFALFYFFPYYEIEIRNTLFFFIAGRYEFRNKGIDIFIEALGKLNKKMKKSNGKKNIVVFFWVPSAESGIKREIIESREKFNDIKDLLEENKDDVLENLLYVISSGKKISKKSIFDDNFILEMKKKLLRFKSRSDFTPPLSTHRIVNKKNDSILNGFKKAGLKNLKEDKVRVIFYPIYLSGADGLGNLDYYQSILASHLGVFPSYYEPWGYTPLETAALGVASVTSNLSGFGKYFDEIVKDKKNQGIYILDREKKNKKKLITEFVDILYRYTQLSKKERIDNKIQARKIASLSDWKNFAKYYIKAHNLSIEKNSSK